jgi:elongator complex protein 3
MPNLLGSTPASDHAGFERVMGDVDIRPHELKIYPGSLIETAELMDHYRRGEWRPYDHDELLEVVVGALARVPRYCRVTRVIRDISSDDIVVGNKLTNFRQIAEAELSRRGGRCLDIRSREIRRDSIDARDLSDRETRYATSVGEECFLETVTPDDRIVGFLRLSLPDPAGRGDRPAEIADSAIIREVHVYGASLELGRIPGGLAQHRGIGGRLVDAAVERARAAGYQDLAVISSVGTRPWYRRLGFGDGALYQHRPLD